MCLECRLVISGGVLCPFIAIVATYHTYTVAPKMLYPQFSQGLEVV